jgi:hypothetical protein
MALIHMGRNIGSGLELVKAEEGDRLSGTSADSRRDRDGDCRDDRFRL